ncbi:tRNA m(1)G methyltransferase Trm10 [Schizosaccharomyces japonicus yFS275]|uniref:tRNA (guanine(9)-N1)-methyltransferase n=1 Tax=Schizosaccharomyces japonicus (strain yFS275 / FY16936) TaxID=402676 RepID=B6K8B6_SCHJY|nr:tRNA m(1)G methyltransferase Trm10 [Schizosaccharomyces japonicus yFS275]EEB09770.1 tRNA m(1)G methyltransferase Trm10 [Schizosaccharomyces japonicus yFS275]
MSVVEKELVPVQSTESEAAKEGLEETKSSNSTSQESSSINAEEPVQMSKSALKRLRRQQEWEAGREERARLRREKKKARKEERKRKKEAGEEVPSQKKKLRPGKVVPSNMRVVLDCAFDDLMNYKEINSLCQQVTRCYSANRTAIRPVHLYATSFGGRLKERQEFVLKGQQNNWKRMKSVEEDYMEVFKEEKDKLVYLSADSENDITELDEDKIYIIGAIVDKNRYKNLCNDKAEKQGIKTARLPIGQYIQMSDRKILTVNQVFEILSLWLEYRDWERAFLEIIPKRKGLQPKSHSTTASELDGDEVDRVTDLDDEKKSAEHVETTLNEDSEESKVDNITSTKADTDKQ